MQARLTDHKFGMGDSQRIAKGVKFERSKSSRGEELRRVERPARSIPSALRGRAGRSATSPTGKKLRCPPFEIGFTGRGDFAMLAALNSDGS